MPTAAVCSQRTAVSHTASNNKGHLLDCSHPLLPSTSRSSSGTSQRAASAGFSRQTSSLIWTLCGSNAQESNTTLQASNPTCRFEFPKSCCRGSSGGASEPAADSLRHLSLGVAIVHAQVCSLRDNATPSTYLEPFLLRGWAEPQTLAHDRVGLTRAEIHKRTRTLLSCCSGTDGQPSDAELAQVR